MTKQQPYLSSCSRPVWEMSSKESLKCGADEYIAKPFDIDMLNLCILNLLKKRKNVSTEYVITEADRKFIDEVNAYIRDII